MSMCLCKPFREASGLCGQCVRRSASAPSNALLAALSDGVFSFRQNLTLLLYVFFMPVILRISKNDKKNKAGTHGIGLLSVILCCHDKD